MTSDKSKKIATDSDLKGVGKNSGDISRKNFWICLLATAGLWQVYFQPAGIWPLGFLLLCPFALAAGLGKSSKRFFFAFWAAGMLCWLAAIYWMSWVTPPGWIGLAFYMGFYWPVAAVLINKLSRYGLGLSLALPLVWVPLEFLRGWLFSGFPWFFISHGLAGKSVFIQSADICGSFGVSFIAIMSSGVLADFIMWRIGKRGGKHVAVSVAALAVLLAANIGYGVFRLNQRGSHISAGPRVAAVQSTFPVSLYVDRVGMDSDIFASLIENSPVNPDSDIDLLLWPETVLPQAFRGPIQASGPSRQSWTDIDLALIDDQQTRVFVAERISMQQELAELLSIQKKSLTMLAGGSTFELSDDGQELMSFNSALLVKPVTGEHGEGDSLKFGPIYSKIHCVPFGEYLPFRESVPIIYKFLRLFVPDQMDQLRPGDELLNYEIVNAEGKKFTVAPCICYEGVISRMCRRLVWGGHVAGEIEPGNGDAIKKADILANLSNDGWFVWPFGDNNFASGELDQHLSAYMFRAVENRVPVVRAVNTGVSCHIDSAGRMVDFVRNDSGQYKMITGSIVADVEIDSRKTFYGRFGDLFAGTISCILVVLLSYAQRKNKHGGKTEKSEQK